MSTAISVAGAVALAVLAVGDARTRVIPNRIVLPAAAAMLALRCTFAPGRWTEWVAATAGTFLFLLVLHVVHPAGLGMGDVKLGLLLGALLGARAPVALVVGGLAVAAAGLALAARGGGVWGRTLPFAPFLALGAFVAMLAATASGVD